ncbi:DUF4845 domain-containing protein [Haliea sp. E17]|uniref:DUF4845 domain-containing protein n=1 Tax=Haliea sp. E17 TaxID=3401576 RepID=UPI003AAB0DC2
MIIIAIMAGFYVMCFVKMIQPYTEYLSIKSIVSQVASEHQPGTTSLTEIRRRIDRLFITNQIYAITTGDVEVYREKGITYIDASYEARIPLVWRIDIVLKFDDLKFVAGQPNSQ